MNQQNFEIGARKYPIEDCYIVGFFEDGIDREIQWNIVAEFPGEDVYASFQNIVIKGVKNFHELENRNFFPEEDDEKDNFLYEGVDEELVFVDSIAFLNVDKENEAITVEIAGFAADEGEIHYDEESEEMELEGEDIHITLTPQFEGIYFFTQNKKNVEKFVKDFMKKDWDSVQVEYEEEEENGGWNCIITYK